ncbi:MAG TPA: DMT family transporter [Polyangia bacterium]|jgi:drug/metabolite transporter (DMT)-like permease|nr:DMT family transporter [Polyangia bacterium]
MDTAPLPPEPRHRLAAAWSSVHEAATGDGEGFGLVLMVVSAASVTLMAAFAKKFLPDAPQQAVVLSRGVFLSVVFVALARYKRAPLAGQRPGLLIGRGFLSYAALSCYFYSVQHLPLGDAVLLQYSHPVYVAAIAPWWLGERTSRSHWGLILLALVGVALIVRPAGEVRAAALVGVLGSLLSAFAYMAVRGLSRTEHPMTILAWFPLATIPPALVAVLFTGRAALPQSGRQVMGHLLVALVAIVGQLTLTYGLTRARAARATAITLTGPVFGLVFGYLFFGALPTTASLVGTIVVLTTLALLGRGR